MKRTFVVATVAALLSAFLTIRPAMAANCGTFTDVQDTDSFCTAVQWLKNRAVTLGCTSATMYCPADGVNRASMALFMNRLGTALTPKFISGQGDIAAQTLTQGLFVPVCIMQGPPATAFPRMSRASGSVGVTASGSKLEMILVVGFNGGPYQNMNTLPLSITSPAGQQSLTWQSNNVAIPANATTFFAVGLVNPVGSGGNVNLGAGVCAIQAEVVNDNPSSPPYDQ